MNKNNNTNNLKIKKVGKTKYLKNNRIMENIFFFTFLSIIANYSFHVTIQLNL